MDFMGVAANIINKNFQKTTIVIGLEMMPGSHNAKNIKDEEMKIKKKKTAFLMLLLMIKFLYFFRTLLLLNKILDYYQKSIPNSFQILPAFQFNLVMQKTSSTIGDVVPTLHIIISKWKRYDLPQSYRQLGFAFIENKFSYELNSRNICSCCFI
jgi:hypothetical protein